LHTEYVVSTGAGDAVVKQEETDGQGQRVRELDIDAKACSKSKSSHAVGWDDHFRSPEYSRSIKELWATVSVRCHQCEQLVATTNIPNQQQHNHHERQPTVIAQADIKCFRKRRLTKAEKQANLRKRIYGGCTFVVAGENGHERRVMQDRKFPHVSKYLEAQMKAHLKHVHCAGKEPKHSSRDLKLSEIRFEALLKEHEQPPTTATNSIPIPTPEQLSCISGGGGSVSHSHHTSSGYPLQNQGLMLSHTQAHGQTRGDEPAWLAMGSPSDAGSSAPTSPGDHLHLQPESSSPQDAAPPSPGTPASDVFACADGVAIDMHATSAATSATHSAAVSAARAAARAAAAAAGGSMDSFDNQERGRGFVRVHSDKLELGSTLNGTDIYAPSPAGLDFEESYYPSHHSTYHSNSSSRTNSTHQSILAHHAAENDDYALDIPSGGCVVDEFRPLQLEDDFYTSFGGCDPTAVAANAATATVDADMLMALGREGSDSLDNIVPQSSSQFGADLLSASSVNKVGDDDDAVMFREMGQLLF
jgi:hypothetical protein